MTQDTNRSAPVEYRDMPGPAERRQRFAAGAILTIVGIGLLGLQLAEGVSEAIWLFVIGTLFLAGYLFRRAYGLLVAGAIVTGVGLGRVGEQIFDTVDRIDAVGLGIGFTAIYVIDRLYTGSSHWWPLIPGGILLATGLAGVGEPFSWLLELAWPLLLIIAGLALLMRTNEKRHRS